MKQLKGNLGLAALSMFLAACSKAPTTTAKDTGPDNAMTRYTESLSRDEQQAKDAADKANAAIAREQQVNQAVNQQ